MNAITFSDRLAGITATIIYTALVIGLTPPVIRHHQLEGTPPGTALMSAGILAFGLLVTVGWRWCLHRWSERLIYLYFAAAVLLLLALFWLENVDTRDGASVSNLFVVLMVQSGVLPTRAKIALHLTATLSLTAIVALVFTRDHVAANTLVVGMTFGAVALMGHIIVRDEKTQTALEAAHRQLAEYAAQAEELATMRERTRLAREIHDNLGHYLTVVNTQIEAARTVMATDPERSTYLLERAQGLTKEGLGEIRRSVAALRTASVEQRPLPEAIQSLVEEHEASGLTIDFRIEGEVRSCADLAEQAVYRAAQEGLTNIRRHARATTAELRLLYSAGRISLSICDNGIGSVRAESGFGLIGLQERVKLLGGEVNTRSVPGGGFTLQVEVPA